MNQSVRSSVHEGYTSHHKSEALQDVNVTRYQANEPMRPIIHMMNGFDKNTKLATICLLIIYFLIKSSLYHVSV